MPNEERIQRLEEMIWNLIDLGDQLSGEAQKFIADAIISIGAAVKAIEKGKT